MRKSEVREENKKVETEVRHSSMTKDGTYRQQGISNIHFKFHGGSAGKESACNAGNPSSTPGWGRFPGGGHGNLLQCSCLENPCGQRSPVGYSPGVAKTQTRLCD